MRCHIHRDQELELVWEPYLAGNRCYPKPCPKCLMEAHVEGYRRGYKDGYEDGYHYIATEEITPEMQEENPVSQDHERCLVCLKLEKCEPFIIMKSDESETRLEEIHQFSSVCKDCAEEIMEDFRALAQEWVFERLKERDNKDC